MVGKQHQFADVVQQTRHEGAFGVGQLELAGQLAGHQGYAQAVPPEGSWITGPLLEQVALQVEHRNAQRQVDYHFVAQ